VSAISGLRYTRPLRLGAIVDESGEISRVAMERASVAPALARVVFAVSVLLALALRLHGLAQPSLWRDEIATAAFIHLPWRALFGPIAHLESNPPGYYVLLKALVPVLGESDFGLRLPSAFAGAAVLLPIFLFCQPFGTPTALLAAVLVALAGTHVHYSQQARNYSMLFLAFSTALLLTDRLADADTPRQRRWALAVLLGLLGGVMEYLHSTAVFAFFALDAYALTLLVMQKRLTPATLLPLMLANLIAFALASWWLSVAVEFAADPNRAANWIERPDLKALGILFSRLLASPSPVASTPLASGLHGGLLMMAALMAWRQRDARAFGLLVGLVAGVGLLFLVSQRVPVLMVRTALFGLAFALPLSAWASLRVRPAWLAVTVSVLLIGLQACSVASNHVIWTRDNEPWRSAVGLIEAALAPGEKVLVLGSFEAFSIDHYGGPRLTAATPVLVSALDRLDVEIIGHLPRMEGFTPETMDRLQDAAGLWMLSCATEHAAGQFSAALRAQGWSSETRESLGEIRLVHWTR
jgi:mannosyltransferase